MGGGSISGRPRSHPIPNWHFQQTATKFEIAGTSNYPGAVGLGASLAQINEIGINKRSTVTSWTSSSGSGQGLERVWAPGSSPRGSPEEVRSGITIFTMCDSPEEDRALLEELLTRKIYLAQRYTSGIGGIRASTHFFNNDDDVDALSWGATWRGV